MPDEPIRTMTYVLVTEDALAYEQAHARLGPPAVVLLIAWLAICGSTALLIPLDWAGPRLGWSFTLLVTVLVAIGYVLALLLMAWLQLRRARRQVRRPVEMQLVEWPDRLELTGGGLPRSVRFSDVTTTLMTRAHLFLATASGPLILPRRAFIEEGSIEDLEKRIAAAKPATPPPVAVDPSASTS